MALRDLAGALGDESLRGMKSGQVSGARRLAVMHHIEQATCLAQSLARPVEVFRGLGRHRSMPSRRTSRISDVRS
jgi:hypothetical protein